MAENAARSRIPSNFAFRSRSPSAATREDDGICPHETNDDIPYAEHIEYAEPSGGVSLTQHSEYAETRESISTVATSHHPSVVSEVSRFSFSTDASSLDDDHVPKAQKIEDSEDAPTGQLLGDHSSGSSLGSESSDSDNDSDVSHFRLEESIQRENTATRCSQSLPTPHSRCWTQSEPLTSRTNCDKAPQYPPDYSPPPSYTDAIQESDESEVSSPAPVADGFFEAHEFKPPPGEVWPQTVWQDVQGSAAPLPVLRLPNITIPRIPSTEPSPSKALQDLHEVRKRLVPYHQDLASYHARAIERYAREAAANLWESQDRRTSPTPLVYFRDIWGPQDELDPIPRPTFQERAVSTT